jgi:hypothetical protein
MQYCGDGGTCEKASEFTHRCSCRDGYANLLNDTSYPCYQQCTQPYPLPLKLKPLICSCRAKQQVSRLTTPARRRLVFRSVLLQVRWDPTARGWGST